MLAFVEVAKYGLTLSESEMRFELTTFVKTVKVKSVFLHHEFIKTKIEKKYVFNMIHDIVAFTCLQ